MESEKTKQETAKETTKQETAKETTKQETAKETTKQETAKETTKQEQEKTKQEQEKTKQLEFKVTESTTIKLADERITISSHNKDVKMKQFEVNKPRARNQSVFTRSLAEKVWKHFFHNQFEVKCLTCKTRTITPFSVRYIAKVPKLTINEIVDYDNLIVCCPICSGKDKALNRSIMPKLKTLSWCCYNDLSLQQKCWCCRTTTLDYFQDWHTAHSAPHADGGVNNLSNTRPTCTSCNLSCSSENLMSYMKRKGYDQRDHVIPWDLKRVQAYYTAVVSKIKKILPSKTLSIGLHSYYQPS
jgi:hypothetical protein